MVVVNLDDHCGLCLHTTEANKCRLRPGHHTHCIQGNGKTGKD